jgi:hypothetical protein
MLVFRLNPIEARLRIPSAAGFFYAALPSAEAGSIAFSISRRMASVRDGILGCALRQFSIKESVLPSRRNLEAALALRCTSVLSHARLAWRGDRTLRALELEANS